MDTKNYQKPTMMVVNLEYQYPLLQFSDPEGPSLVRYHRSDGFDED